MYICVYTHTHTHTGKVKKILKNGRSRKLDIVRISILYILIYRCNAIAVKIPAGFFF